MGTNRTASLDLYYINVMETHTTVYGSFNFALIEKVSCNRKVESSYVKEI